MYSALKDMEDFTVVGSSLVRLAACVCAVLMTVAPVRAEEPDFLTFGAGYYDLFDD